MDIKYKPYKTGTDKMFIPKETAFNKSSLKMHLKQFQCAFTVFAVKTVQNILDHR